MIFRRMICSAAMFVLIGMSGLASAQSGGGDGGSRPALRGRAEVTGSVAPSGSARLVRVGSVGPAFGERDARTLPAARRCGSLLCSGYLLLGIGY